jgi:hypothetical protein
MSLESSGNFTTLLRNAWRVAATAVFVACAARVAPASSPGTAVVRGPAEPVLPSAGVGDASVSVTSSALPLLPPPDAALEIDAMTVVATPAPEGHESACNEQTPQPFLIRGNFLKEPHGNERAIQYRTEQYGYFPGFGRPGASKDPPSVNTVETTFMGLPVRMHRKVLPALECVEEEIRRSCAEHPYKPQALAGIRYRNTYRGGEVTNHAYGIAIDIDPAINTCCGCVKPWNDAPLCKRPAKTEYDRMAMPECWVHAFERYGFYWLGHDVLRDTMHFEFLGDPDQILKVASAVGDAGPDAR